MPSDEYYAAIGRRVVARLEAITARRKSRAMALQGDISLILSTWSGKPPTAAQVRECLPHPRPSLRATQRHLAQIRRSS